MMIMVVRVIKVIMDHNFCLQEEEEEEEEKEKRDVLKRKEFERAKKVGNC